MERTTLIKIVVAAGIIAVAVWLFFNRHLLEMETLVTWIAGFGILGPLVYMVARSVGAVFFIPGSIMAIAAGVAFGPFWGAIYNLISSTIGAVLAFLVARYLASDLVRQKSKGCIKRVIEGVEAEGWRFVAFVRLVPLFPYNGLNYALGVTRIKLSHFTMASLICMIPGDIAYVYIGYAGREALAGKKSSIVIGLVALGLLATIIFLPRLVKLIRKTPTALTSADETPAGRQSP